MNKKSWVIVVVLVVVIVGSLAYVFSLQNDRGVKQVNDQGAKEVSSTPPSPGKTDGAVAKGVYLPYDVETLASAEGTILLFFHAPWCPQCRAIEKSINEGGVPDNVTVLKVDYDTNQALRQKYGVTLQTTFVKVDNQGNKLASYVAYEEPTFTAVQRELLP